MGPSVKFVSAIIDAIFNKKWGLIFFTEKKTMRGGVRGGYGKRPYFFPFFGTLPLAKFFKSE